MCGIAGMFNYEGGVPINKDVLVKMRDAMTHRGPDGAGLWSSKDKMIALAHRRLSVIDISDKANQPMANENGTIWIVFNGEIYNHSEIRTRLEKNGHRFKTDHSDTEVIVHAFEEWGIDCLHKFRGMFAFAVWDGIKKELWLARDRMGVKPLYYAIENGIFIFASEIRALFNNDNLKKEIDTESIYHYLTFLTVPAPSTMFRSVYKVEAGTALKIDKNGQILKLRYWDPANFLNNPLENEKIEEVIEKTEVLLKEAVALRMISDVPLGLTFSGGVDSSLIASLMKQQKNNLSAIMIDYETESIYSESKIGKQIAGILGLRLNIGKVCNEEYYEAVNEFLNIQSDYPIGDPNIILLYMISKFAKDSKMTVCLVGEGGDELGGYPFYFELDRESKILEYFSSLPVCLKKMIYSLSPEKIKRRIGVALGDTVISRRHIHAFTEEEKRKMWLSDDVESSYIFLKKFMDEVNPKTEDKFLRKILNIEFKLRLPELILARVDYPTMAHSVEARVPFLDHKLVEYSLRLPMKIKMRNNVSKYVLKKILCKYLDRKYVYRNKIGFGMMLVPFLNEVLPSWFKKEILSRKNHPIFSYINKNYLSHLYEEHGRKKDNGFKMWTVYALARWLTIHH